jgi:predicted metal-dependent HD superfamily phosphohydrolase
MPTAIPVLWNNWNASNRYYHNLDHLKSVIKEIERLKHRFSEYEFVQLILAAFFHDAIYDPKNLANNEDLSIRFFRKVYIGKGDRFSLVDKAIECTKYRKRPIPFPLRAFWEADNAVFSDSWENFLKYENRIRKEFSFVDDDIYKKERIRFLEKNIGIFGIRGNNNIKKLIEKINS